MSARIRVEPLGQTFNAEQGQTVLEAALAAGLELPSSCRNGTCRACLCRLVQGSVDYRIPWPGLLPEEKAGGWTLPCVAVPHGDLVICYFPSTGS